MLLYEPGNDILAVGHKDKSVGYELYDCIELRLDKMVDIQSGINRGYKYIEAGLIQFRDRMPIGNTFYVSMMLCRSDYDVEIEWRGRLYELPREIFVYYDSDKAECKVRISGEDEAKLTRGLCEHFRKTMARDFGHGMSVQKMQEMFFDMAQCHLNVLERKAREARELLEAAEKDVQKFKSDFLRGAMKRGWIRAEPSA